MFGEIAREGMASNLITFLEKKAVSCKRDKKTLRLIREFAQVVLEEVDFPGDELKERVRKLKEIIK